MFTRIERSSSVVANRWFISESRSTFALALSTSRVGILVVGLVAQVLHHRQLLRCHLRRDLLEHLGAGRLERQLVDHDLAVLDLDTARASAACRCPSCRSARRLRGSRRARRPVGKSGPLTCFISSRERRVRLVEQLDQGARRPRAGCAAARPSTCRRRCRSCRSRAGSAAAPAAASARCSVPSKFSVQSTVPCSSSLSSTCA